jgi:hypothetical protein
VSTKIEREVKQSMIGEIDARRHTLLEERKTLLAAAERLAVIDTTLAILGQEKQAYEDEIVALDAPVRAPEPSNV